MPTITFSNIGPILRKRREGLQLNQEDLAEISGVAVKTIYSIEMGKGNPSIETLTKLLEVLGMELILQVRQS